MARSELLGFIFIVLLGSALHFTFEVSGRFWIVGVFSAMNESVWEHLKLAFWPSLFWTGILHTLGASATGNFWAGRTIALALPPILIAVGFYTYTGFLGRHLLVLDIGLFVFSIAIGQLCAVLIYRTKFPLRDLRWVLAGAIILITFLFSVASFFPPDLPIFIDESIH